MGQPKPTNLWLGGLHPPLYENENDYENEHFIKRSGLIDWWLFMKAIRQTGFARRMAANSC